MAADNFEEIVELAQAYFDETDGAIREYVLVLLWMAGHFARHRYAGSESDARYLDVQDYLNHLAEGVEDIEPRTLDALAFAAGGSVDIQFDVAVSKLQELEVTYWPKTARDLVADLMADMRPPN